MIMDGKSERRFLKMLAIASVLATALGACQKENAVMPFGGQADKTPAQPDRNAGGTSNSSDTKQPSGQNGGDDTGQKSQ